MSITKEQLVAELVKAKRANPESAEWENYSCLMLGGLCVEFSVWAYSESGTADISVRGGIRHTSPSTLRLVADFMDEVECAASIQSAPKPCTNCQAPAPYSLNADALCRECLLEQVTREHEEHEISMPDGVDLDAFREEQAMKCDGYENACDKAAEFLNDENTPLCLGCAADYQMWYSAEHGHPLLDISQAEDDVKLCWDKVAKEGVTS